MKDDLSRRDFMAKSAVALGAALACELAGFEAWASGSREETMPHISVKLWPGRSEETKQRLADAMVKDAVEILGCSASSISVSIEEVPSGDWKEKVYEPDIRGKKELLYKRPGYSM